jgi:hypothetical protein
VTEPAINVRVTRYEVTALPDDVVNNRGGFVLTVEYRGNGRWGIYEGGRCWNRRTGEWDHERLPSGRADAWLREHRFARVMDALETAKTLAPTLTVNGWTVEQAIRMERGEVVTRG